MKLNLEILETEILENIGWLGLIWKLQINIQQIANITMYSNHDWDIITRANRIVYHQNA